MNSRWTALLVLGLTASLANVAGAMKVSGVLVRGRWLGADEIKLRMRRDR